MNEFVARNGLIALDNSTITGSLNVTNGITSSLFGTSSWAQNFITSSVTSASFASTAFTASSAISSSFSTTSSFSLSAFTASSAVSAYTASSAVNSTNALTASSADDFVVRQSITASNALITGTVSASSFVKSGGTSAQILAADGSVITAGSNITISGGTISSTGGSGTATGDKISSGSVTASVDINGDTFSVISGSSTFLYVSSSGNVGIGTTTPSSNLVVSKNANGTTNLNVSNTTSGSGAVASITATSDTTSGKIEIGKYSTSTSTYKIVAAKDAYLYSNVGGDISILNDFSTGNIKLAAGASTSAQMFISASGNVGIGTIVPSSKLQVSGTTNLVNFRGSGSSTSTPIFTVDGASGRLFSVNDSLSGSLFSVNTIAGLPVIEAFSDNTVRIGQYGQRALFVSQSRVGIGKESILNGVLDVSGSMYLTGSLFNSGNITTTGTITAQTLVVQTITSSTSWITGSSKFGNVITDTHQFTGSVSVSGSITGTPTVINNLTASFAISSSFAVSASWAPSVPGFRLLSSQSYTSVGTVEWYKPSTAQIVSVVVVGGGGGGASGAAAVGSGVAGGAGGGSGGGVVMVTLPAVVFDVTESVVVGAGGAGGSGSIRIGAGANATTAGQNGFSGSDSSFGEITAPGGGGGTYTAANNALGLGGAPPNIVPTLTTDAAAAGYTITSNYTPLIAYSGPGGSGAATDKSPTAVAPLTMSTFVPTGGGYGGTPGSTTTDEIGSAGGFSNTSFGLISGGTPGTSTLISGSIGNLVADWFGTGGGGGFGDYAASGIALATNGGSGSRGAGGGGGGSARNNTNTNPNSATSGNGGPGGSGAVIVYVYGT